MPCTNKGGSVYTITTPTGKTITDEWRFKKETFDNLLTDNRLVFPKGGDGKPRYKLFLNEKIAEGMLPNTWWDNEASNQEASIELKEIFQAKIFDTPKPTKLLTKILQIASDKSSIILDSFAGSGTTAHAVLNLNKQDGGNRKFILVEMEDYAENITAERVRRVIKGYGNTEGTGGSFDFYELGEPIFDADGNLNENIGTEKLREYIWYSETRTPLATTVETNYLLGNHNDTAYYFYYEKDKITTLSHETLNIVGEKAETYVIYADQCVIDKEWLAANHIIFKKIPRDIRKF